jgi:hypothetical protein
MRPKRRKSDSTVQRRIEETVRQSLAKKLGWAAAIEKRRFNCGESWVELDCYSEAGRAVLVGEINAHYGELKAAQKNKVLRDILKMHLVHEELRKKPDVTDVRLAIIFTNEAAARFLTAGRTWAAEAARSFGIECVVVPLTKREASLLQRAQRDQDLRS